MLPLKTLQTARSGPGEINNYWISTATRDHAAIDRITARVEDALAARRQPGDHQERHVQKRDAISRGTPA